MNTRVLTSLIGCAALIVTLGCGVDRLPGTAKPKRPAEETEWPGQLKAGVALPQTLPDGTQIGFSVDYRFRTYTPDPQKEYVWEIRQGDGTIHRIPVSIANSKGTLSQFLAIRPEAGPFTSRICIADGEEGESTPLTDWASMQ